MSDPSASPPTPPESGASPAPASPERPARGVLGLVFLTAFLDLAGFSILFPLFPDMLDHYLAREGEASAIGRLVEFLRGLAGEDGNSEFLVTTLFGGILGSVYSVLQFLFAPVWGGLSDRIGRRPVLVVTLTGTALAYVGWFFAGTFAVLVASRLFAGLMAGNIATASAVVADVTSAKERTKGMGVLGAAVGLGFIFGPAIGGLSSHFDLSGTWASSGSFSVNPFSAAALAAFSLALVNLVGVVARLPETHPRERRGLGEGRRSISPLIMFGRSALGVPVARVNLIYFSVFLAFSAIEFTLVFLAVERFEYTPRDNAWMFVYVGFLIALVQGGALRKLAPRYGDRTLALAGHVLLAPGFVLVGVSEQQTVLFAGLTCMSVGSALIVPSLSALVSRYAPEERQGFALGTFRSVGSLARAIGPLAGGVLYWQLGSEVPYLSGAAFLVVPTLLALSLPRPAPGLRGGPDEP